LSKVDIKKTRLRWRYKQFLYVLAYVWRRLLLRTTFIAITGSVGKTTTKELIAAIFSAHFSTAKTLYNQNDFYGVPRTILRVRPWHRFAVVEIGTDQPGLVGRSARLVRPDIAVVLAVARTHTKAFKTLEDTAAEKAQILEALPSQGLAILNGEDDRVRKMADGCPCKVKMFGRSNGLDLWADEVSSKWPARLTLRAHTEAETQLVKTNLVGEQWANAILAALVTATACGIPLTAAAAQIEQVQPFPARMQPATLAGRAVVLRDESDNSPDTLLAALRVLEESIATRRVLVIGDVSDFRGNPRQRFKALGKTAAQIFDLAVFVGEHAHHAARTAVSSGMKPESAVNFIDPHSAALYLKSELRDGDLVLLKGRASDHLSRVFFAQFGNISCWKTRCRKTFVCDFCKELRPEYDLRTITI
jgi:UDP-N-acetylmuramoyl-tripeptide--D-alanyl-D-alanine ligase